MSFWDSRFLVTGGTGFLGGYVIRRAALVSPIVYVPHRSDYDLRDTENVNAMFKLSRPDIVIHLAASVGGIGANMEHPGEYFYDNLTMGVNLMHTAKSTGVRKFVTIGTVCSYPKHTPVPFREDDLWNGYPEETNAPYGVAKKALLVMGQAYRQQYGLNAIYLLPTNLYGPGDNFDPGTSHVIPAMIKKFIEAEERGDNRVTLWGTGKASRDFLYVEDAAAAIIAATRDYDSPEPVNIGSGREITIAALADTIAELCGYRGLIDWDTNKPDGQPRRALNTSRARDAFGWKAEVSFDVGLRKTIDWYKKGRENAGD